MTFDNALRRPYTIETIPDNGAWFVQIKELRRVTNAEVLDVLESIT